MRSDRAFRWAMMEDTLMPEDRASWNRVSMYLKLSNRPDAKQWLEIRGKTIKLRKEEES